MKPSLTPVLRSTESAAVMPWRDAVVRRPTSHLAILAGEMRRACGAFEWVTLVYFCIMNSLLFIMRKNLPAAPRYLLAHTCVAAGVVALAWASARWPNTAVRFARHWYPLPLFLLCFEELGGLVHLIFPGWFDRWLIEFDYRLVGVHPSVWLSQFSTPLLNDFMQAAYMTYFLLLVILPAILYFENDRRAFWTSMVSIAIAHYTVYVIAVLFPVQSPHFALAELNHIELSGGASTGLINLIERFGRVHGAAFPSAHVAGAFAVILATWRYRRWLFWICLLFFAAMLVATVYGRYHYIADGLAGLVTGAIGYFVGLRLMRRPGALPMTVAIIKEAEEQL